MKHKKNTNVDYKLYKHYDDDFGKVHRIINGVMCQLRKENPKCQLDFRAVYNDLHFMGFLLLHKHNKYAYKIGVFALSKEWTKEQMKEDMENAMDNFQNMDSGIPLASILG